MTRLLVHSSLAALLFVASSATLSESQLMPRGAAPHTGGAWAEGYLSRVHLDAGGSRTGLDAMGFRLTRELHPGLPIRRSLTERLAVGVFMSTSPELLPQQGASPRAEQYGVHADLRLTSRPLGRLEPIASMGTGVLRLQETYERLPPPRLEISEVVRHIYAGEPMRLRESRSSVMLAPSIGARYIASPDFAIRVDVRDVIPLREGMRHATELAAGISLAL